MTQQTPKSVLSSFSVPMERIRKCVLLVDVPPSFVPSLHSGMAMWFLLSWLRLMNRMTDSAPPVGTLGFLPLLPFPLSEKPKR